MNRKQHCHGTGTGTGVPCWNVAISLVMLGMVLGASISLFTTIACTTGCNQMEDKGEFMLGGSRLVSSDGGFYANFTANDTQIFENQRIKFTFTGDLGIAPVTFQWDFGDGKLNATTQDALHRYDSPGNFTVTLTITDSYGNGSTLARSNYIQVMDLVPVANFTMNCTNVITVQTWVSFQFTGFDGSLPANYSWDFGDSLTSVAREPIHQYTSTGNFSIVLEVRDRNGNMSTVTKLIRVVEPAIDPAIVAGFTANRTEIEVGASIQFNFTGSTGGAPASFLWSFDDGTGMVTTEHATHAFMKEGRFNVTLVVVGAGGRTAMHTMQIVVSRPFDFMILLYAIAIPLGSIGLIFVIGFVARKRRGMTRTVEPVYVDTPKEALDIGQLKEGAPEQGAVSTGLASSSRASRDSETGAEHDVPSQQRFQKPVNKKRRAIKTITMLAAFGLGVGGFQFMQSSLLPAMLAVQNAPPMSESAAIAQAAVNAALLPTLLLLIPAGVLFVCSLALSQYVVQEGARTGQPGDVPARQVHEKPRVRDSGGVSTALKAAREKLHGLGQVCIGKYKDFNASVQAYLGTGLQRYKRLEAIKISLLAGAIVLGAVGFYIFNNSTDAFLSLATLVPAGVLFLLGLAVPLVKPADAIAKPNVLEERAPKHVDRRRKAIKISMLVIAFVLGVIGFYLLNNSADLILTLAMLVPAGVLFVLGLLVRLSTVPGAIEGTETARTTQTTESQSSQPSTQSPKPGAREHPAGSRPSSTTQEPSKQDNGHPPAGTRGKTLDALKDSMHGAIDPSQPAYKKIKAIKISLLAVAIGVGAIGLYYFDISADAFLTLAMLATAGICLVVGLSVKVTRQDPAMKKQESPSASLHATVNKKRLAIKIGLLSAAIVLGVAGFHFFNTSAEAYLTIATLAPAGVLLVLALAVKTRDA